MTSSMFLIPAILLLLVLVVAWVVLPIAIIGTKPILKELLAEQKKTNALLEANRERIQTLAKKVGS